MEAKTNKISTFINSKPFVIAKKVLWGIVCGLFAVIAALVIWLAIDKFILKSTVPSVFGYATLTIETGSMESELQIGDMILIKDTGDYKIGDIITYAHEGDKIPTTHRIIGYTDDGFVTKGDNNNVKDTDDVPTDIVVGEVIKVFPKVGLFSKWVQQEGWMYIVAVLAIIALGGLVLKSDDDETTEEPTETTNEENNLEENSSEENISSVEEASPFRRGTEGDGENASPFRRGSEAARECNKTIDNRFSTSVTEPQREGTEGDGEV